MSRLSVAAHVACTRCGEATPICASDWIVDPFSVQCPICARRDFYTRAQLISTRGAVAENSARRERRAFGLCRGTDSNPREFRA